MRFVALLLSGAVLGAAPRPRLQLKIDEVISHSPTVAAAFVGLRVVSLRDGRVLYAHDQDRLFAPASNTKLFTTALALNVLGPDYRFITRIFASQPIDASGRVAGDVVLLGSGDPSISNRVYPYQRPEPGAKPQPFETVGAIETLADQLVARGLKSVDGNIVGDDRRYLFEPYPDGWSADDAVWEYGAPVSALVVNDNAFTLWIKPGGRPADLARLDTSPSVVPFNINNRLVTTAAGERKIYEDRQIRSKELQVWGEIPVSDSGTSDLLAVDDPAVFAAAMLRDALVRRGVSIRGSAAASHLLPNQVDDPKRGSGPPAATGVEVAQRTSPPLIQLLQVIDKVSQNLHAEVMLREVGAVRRGIGSREAGQEEMKTFLAEIGISAGEYHLVDGSGLSRLTSGDTRRDHEASRLHVPLPVSQAVDRSVTGRRLRWHIKQALRKSSRGPAHSGEDGKPEPCSRDVRVRGIGRIRAAGLFCRRQ